MSRSTSRSEPPTAVRRSRSVALLAAGALAGAPVLATVPAYGVAAQRPTAQTVEADRRVVFNGAGLLGLTCAANPDLASVTIAAESTLRVVNQTGHRATLLLDGSPRGEVARGSTAEVLFHRGPVALALKPQCALPEQASVRVQVIPPRAVAPPPPSPSGRPDPAHRPTTAGGSDGDGSGGTGRGSSGDDTGSARSRAARGDSGSGDPSSGRGWPEDGTGTPSTGADNLDGSGSEADTGDGSALDPFAAGAADLVPPSAGGEMVNGASQADMAAEPMASVDPVEEEGPIGLLALISVICILGVSIGAIRAILAQRASRTSMA